MSNDYWSGYQAAQSEQRMRDFWASERAAGRGPAHMFAGLVVLGVCLAVPAVAVMGLHAWLGKMAFFVAHPLFAKLVYGTVAISLFCLCAAFQKAIRTLLAVVFAVALMWMLWSWIAVLVLDGIH